MSMREERIRESILRDVQEGRANYDIRNRIKAWSLSLAEERDAIEYLKLVREREGDRNLFSGEANLADFDRSPVFGHTSDRIRSVVGQKPQEADQPTDYARTQIARIPDILAEMRRNHRRVNKSSFARALGVDRSTIHNWIKRGWMAWPPA